MQAMNLIGDVRGKGAVMVVSHFPTDSKSLYHYLHETTCRYSRICALHAQVCLVTCMHRHVHVVDIHQACWLQLLAFCLMPFLPA